MKKSLCKHISLLLTLVIPLNSQCFGMYHGDNGKKPDDIPEPATSTSSSPTVSSAPEQHQESVPASLSLQPCKARLLWLRDYFNLNKNEPEPIDDREISLLWSVITHLEELISILTSPENHFDVIKAQHARDILIPKLYRLARFRLDQAILHLNLAERIDTEAEPDLHPLSETSHTPEEEQKHRSSGWAREIYYAYNVANTDSIFIIIKNLHEEKLVGAQESATRRKDYRFQVSQSFARPAFQRLEYLYRQRIGILPLAFEWETPYLTILNPLLARKLRAQYYSALDELIMSDALTAPLASFHSFLGTLQQNLGALRQSALCVHVTRLIHLYLEPLEVLHTLAQQEELTLEKHESLGSGLVEILDCFGSGVNYLQKALQKYMEDDPAKRIETEKEKLYQEIPWRVLRNLGVRNLYLYQRNNPDEKKAFYRDEFLHLLPHLSALLPTMQEIIAQELFQVPEENAPQRYSSRAARDALISKMNESINPVILSYMNDVLTPQIIQKLKDIPPEQWTEREKRAFSRIFWILGESSRHLTEDSKTTLATQEMWDELRKIRDLLKGKKQKVFRFLMHSENAFIIEELLEILHVLTIRLSQIQTPAYAGPSQPSQFPESTLVSLQKFLILAGTDTGVEVHANPIKPKDPIREQVEEIAEQLLNSGDFARHPLKEEIERLKSTPLVALNDEFLKQINNSRYLDKDHKKVFQNLAKQQKNSITDSSTSSRPGSSVEETVKLRQQAEMILANLSFDDYMRDKVEKLLVNRELVDLLVSAEIAEHAENDKRSDEQSKKALDFLKQELKKLSLEIDANALLENVRTLHGLSTSLPPQQKLAKRITQKTKELLEKLNELKQFMFSGRTKPKDGLFLNQPFQGEFVEKQMIDIYKLAHIYKMCYDFSFAPLINKQIPAILSETLCIILEEEVMFLAVEDFFAELRALVQRKDEYLDKLMLFAPDLASLISSQYEAFQSIGNFLAHLGSIVDLKGHTKAGRIEELIRLYRSIFEEEQARLSLIDALSLFIKYVEEGSLLHSSQSVFRSSSEQVLIYTAPNEEGSIERRFKISTPLPHTADSGFSALGLTRAQAIRQLLTNMSRSDIRHAVADDIFAALIADQLPLSLQTPLAEALAKKYHRLQSHFYEAHNLFRDDELQQRLSILEEEKQELAIDLERFLTDEKTFVDFILSRFGDGGYLTYMPLDQARTFLYGDQLDQRFVKKQCLKQEQKKWQAAFNGSDVRFLSFPLSNEKKPPYTPEGRGTLYALGIINKLNIHIWKNRDDTHMLPIPLAPGLEGEEVHLLHTDGLTRFERLECMAENQACSSTPFSPPTPQSFSWMLTDIHLRSNNGSHNIEINPSVYAPLKLPLLRSETQDGFSIEYKHMRASVCFEPIQLNGDEEEEDIDISEHSLNFKTKSEEPSQIFSLSNRVIFFFPEEAEPLQVAGLAHPPHIPPGEIFPVAADGNCMYEALREGARRLGKYREDLACLRQEVADHIRDNLDEYHVRILAQLLTIIRERDFAGLVGEMRERAITLYRKFIRAMINHQGDYARADAGLMEDMMQNDDVNRYINMIRENHAWGGDVELGVLGRILGVQIIVHRTELGTTDPVINNTGDEYAPTIHVAHDGRHYQLYLTPNMLPQEQPTAADSTTSADLQESTSIIAPIASSAHLTIIDSTNLPTLSPPPNSPAEDYRQNTNISQFFQGEVTHHSKFNSRNY